MILILLLWFLFLKLFILGLIIVNKIQLAHLEATFVVVVDFVVAVVNIVVVFCFVVVLVFVVVVVDDVILVVALLVVTEKIIFSCGE